MEFATLRRHWKESLSILQKKELVLFLLATLNNYQRSLKVIATNFWWQILLFVGFKMLAVDYAKLFNINKKTYLLTRSLCVGGFTVASLYILFFFLLTTRPAIEAKNYIYFNQYQRFLWGFFVLYALMALTHAHYAFPFVVLATLFFTDLNNTATQFMTALQSAGRFCLHFLPIITIFFMCYAGAVLLDNTLAAIVQRLVSTHQGFISLGVIPFCITLCTLITKFLFITALCMYYVKIKHQYHEFLFPHTHN